MYFLKPTYSLRNQLLRSFGNATAVAGIISFIAAIVCYYLSSKILQQDADTLFCNQIVSQLKTNNKYVAGTFTEFSSNFETALLLVREILTNCIVGYPESGWEDDRFVPFPDMDTGENIYPLKSKPLPLDWEIDLNINESNKVEHLQERARLFDTFPAVSTSSASYFMQGICDPNEFNSSSVSYYENCTVENNNVTTGGAIKPTATNLGLYQKSADLGIFLKPVYESHPEILQIAIYFHNSGAGSVLRYPGGIGLSFDVSDQSSTYVSAGCDWMR